MKIPMCGGWGGGWVFELGNPEGRGAQAVLEIQVEGGGDFCHGGVDFFGNNPMHNAFVQKIVIDSYCHTFVMT